MIESADMPALSRLSTASEPMARDRTEPPCARFWTLRPLRQTSAAKRSQKLKQILQPAGRPISSFSVKAPGGTEKLVRSNKKTSRIKQRKQTPMRLAGIAALFNSNISATKDGEENQTLKTFYQETTYFHFPHNCFWCRV